MVVIKKKSLLFLVMLVLIFPAGAHLNQDTLTTITINAVGGLKYDKVRFQVKPGAKMKILFVNKDDMPHNLVITAPGARVEVVNAALGLGENGPEMNYVPGISKVLWSTAALNPAETTSLTFTAPEKEGIYPYVCTYPGHGLVMFGAMYVTNKAMPAIESDPNIPPGQKVSDAIQHNDRHPMPDVSKPSPPYTQDPPFLYRIFVPDASPTAIAVRLPGNIAYCWDAATCHLRYAWEGEFLDNTEIWKGHFQAYAKVMGEVFFRNKTRFPLYVDKPGNIPTVKFKGYRLVDRYPEFHYAINGIDVYERLKETEAGAGLIRTFSIPKSDRTIWFAFTDDDGVDYHSSIGGLGDGKLKLPPGENIQFTITMTKRKL